MAGKRYTAEQSTTWEESWGAGHTPAIQRIALSVPQNVDRVQTVRNWWEVGENQRVTRAWDVEGAFRCGRELKRSQRDKLKAE